MNIVYAQEFKPRNRRPQTQTDAEKNRSTYGLSDWFKLGQNRLKARQSRQKSGIPWPLRAKIRYDVSLANSRTPGVCFVLVLSMYLVTDFGRKVARYPGIQVPDFA